MANARRRSTLKLAGSAATWEFYREPDGRWRWQRVDSDGKVVGMSPHSYRHLLECLSNAKSEGCTDEAPSRFMSWPA